MEDPSSQPQQGLKSFAGPLMAMVSDFGCGAMGASGGWAIAAGDPKRRGENMEFEELVRKRRSIRTFSHREVPDDVLRGIVECALQAPSSMDGQPWYFVLVRGQETKRRLTEIKNKYCPPEKRTYPAEFLQDAPVIIVTCVERARAYDRGVESGVLATGHLLLAAANQGLAGVYLSAYKAETPEVAEDIREALGLPSTVDPITIVPVGYPGSVPGPKRVRSVDEVVFHEAFGER